ncbi:MAG: CotH kinase family protein [Archangium sp.]|nr:CotH kinase family protein [Archangium sp.]
MTARWLIIPVFVALVSSCTVTVAPTDDAGTTTSDSGTGGSGGGSTTGGGTGGGAGGGGVTGGGVAGGGGATGGGATDSGTDLDAGTDAGMMTVDAGGPTPYVPDPVTMGLNLPSVVPVIKINVNGATIQKDVEVPGTIQIFEQHAGTLMDLTTATPTFSGPIGFEGRGNFTWTLPKKGYAFELQDAMGAGIELPILGFPAGADFALYACYTDKTCLRNALVYALGQQLGRWSPRTRYVELFIDNQYMGLYMVWERVRRDADRVALPRPAATQALGDITGGYIIRHEGGGKGGGADFTLMSNRVYTFHYPSETNITAEQRTYITGSFQQMEDLLAANPSTAYANALETESWVDRAILEEVTNNWDGYVHSIYMTKARASDGGKFGMGPVWDFDLAFGNGNVTGYNCRTDNWAYQIVRGYPDDMPTYWTALFAQPAFQRDLKCRWQSLRQGPLALATFDARMTAWSSFTAAARVRDQARWMTIGRSIFPNCDSEMTYQDEVTWLHDWIAARLIWLDGQIAAMPGTCP